jgi:hypothetical protein
MCITVKSINFCRLKSCIIFTGIIKLHLMVNFWIHCLNYSFTGKVLFSAKSRFLPSKAKMKFYPIQGLLLKVLISVD